MEQSKYEYFYNDIIKWASLTAPEGFWGTPEHEEVVWSMCKEENLVELPEAFAEDNVAHIAKEICDCFVVNSQALEIFTTDDQTRYPLPSMMSISKFIYTARSIIEQQEKEYVYILMAALTKCMDMFEYNFNVDLEPVMMAVCQENWSKVPTVEELKEQYGEDLQEALKAASDEIETRFEGRYKDVVGMVVGASEDVQRVVFRCDGGAGKLLKPWSHKEADIEGIVGGVK